jgi:hypothetical protein
VLTEEKLDEMGARLERTPQITEIPCTKDWHLEIISSLCSKAA